MTNEIDWTKAPEGATHYYKDVQCFYRFREDGSGDVFLREEWERCSNAEVFDGCLIPKPLQPALSKTFKCKQNNKMYIVGCLYEFKDESGSSWELGRLVDIDGRNFRSDTGTKREWYAEIREVSIEVGSITDAPIELIDGEAYQFDCTSRDTEVTVNGIYSKSGSVFISPYGSFPVTTCTNIKLLEVRS